MKARNIIILCFTLVGALLLMVALAVWLIYSRLMRPFGSLPETPPELQQPRVTQGEGVVSREDFFKIDHRSPIAKPRTVGRVEDIVARFNDQSSAVEIVVAGSTGAVVLDQNANQLEQVRYEFETVKRKVFGIETSDTNTMLGDMEIVDLEVDGRFEYLGRGSIGGAAVFDHQGKRLWAYGKFTEEKTSVDDVAVGDLDGDGIAEFVAIWDGIEVFSKSGKMKWRKEDQLASGYVQVLDIDDDGRNEIAHSHFSDLIIRDRKGEVIRQVDMPFYLSHISLCYSPGAKKQPTILAVEDGYLWLTDFHGKVKAQFEAPLSEVDTEPRQTPVGESRGESVYKAEGEWVRLKKGEPEYLVVITEFAAIDRSVLYIYRPSGELVYQEILPEHCRAIAALPQTNADAPQEFLIGGEQTVWRYAAR